MLGVIKCYEPIDLNVWIWADTMLLSGVGWVVVCVATADI